MVQNKEQIPKTEVSAKIDAAHTVKVWYMNSTKG